MQFICDYYTYSCYKVLFPDRYAAMGMTGDVVGTENTI